MQLDRFKDVVSSVRKLDDLSAGLDVFHKATLDMFQEPIVRALPNVLVENLNLDRPIVSGIVHSLPQLRNSMTPSPIMARPIRMEGSGTG
jgi:hypothetical protein